MVMTLSKPRFGLQLVARAALLTSIPATVLGCAEGTEPNSAPVTGEEMSNSPGTQAPPAATPPGSPTVPPGPSTGGSTAADQATSGVTPVTPSSPAMTPTGAGADGSSADPDPATTDSSGDTGGTVTMGGEATQDTSSGDGTSVTTMPGGDTTANETTTFEGTGDTEPVFHIFLMMGQSNMVGVAGLQESDRNTDERLQVLGGCNKPPMQWNLADPPLHDCYMNPVGPGDWFGKVMLEKLPEGHTIGLVPTAVSGESINTFISGGKHHQDILDKIEFAKNTPNARFEGIIFHQGETDTNQDWWVSRVVQLYDEVKAAMGIDYDIPFIAGELPADPGNCCASHNPRIHELPAALPMGYVVSQEGTKRFDQYHFDHDSVVLMGKRYGETMLEALGW